MTNINDVINKFLLEELATLSDITEQIRQENNLIKFEKFKKSFWSTKKILEIVVKKHSVDEYKFVTTEFISDNKPFYSATYNLDEILFVANKQCKECSMKGFNLDHRGASSAEREEAKIMFKMGDDYKRIANIHKAALKLFDE